MKLFRWVLLLCLAVPLWAQAQKPLLLFEIEEGFREELIYRYRSNFTAMDAGLQAIINSLTPLTAQYDVAVLIYPVSLYDRNAYGKANPQPIDCWHTGLLHAMQYFESRYDTAKIGVFLEAISSGNDTKQNGDIYSIPPAPLYNTPGALGVPALAFDVATLAATKTTYPKSMKGIRLHETHYPRDISGNLIKPAGKTFGFDLPSTVTQALVDTCKTGQMKFVWNNSDWLQNAIDQRDQGYLPYVNNTGKYTALLFSSYYAPQQDYAIAQLGADCILTNANNNYHPAPSFDLVGSKATGALANWMLFDLPWTDHPIKTYPGLQAWGCSDQSWLWPEFIHGSSGQYYAQSEMACPIELVIAWTHRMLGQGAKLIQYEPGWYFWNNGLVGTPIDGSERQVMKRLREALLQPTASTNPPTEISFHFDSNLQKLLEFSRTNRPRLYAQNTLVKRGSTIRAYDFYNGMRNWVTDQPARLPDVFSNASTTRLTRFCLQGNTMDYVAAAQRVTPDYDFLYFYDPTGRLLASDLALLAPNANGDVVAMAAANFIPEDRGEGDPDELIVARQTSGGTDLKLDICKITTYNPQLRSFAIKYNTALTLTFALQGQKLLGLTGLRDTLEDNIGTTSPLDRVLVATGSPVTQEVTLSFINSGGSVDFQATLQGTYQGARLSMTTLDIDNDLKDELLVSRTRGRREWLDVYRVNASGVTWAWSQQVGSLQASSVKEWQYP